MSRFTRALITRELRAAVTRQQRKKRKRKKQIKAGLKQLNKNKQKETA